MRTTALASKKATYADIEALPPNMVGEIIYGTLHAHPRPAPRHARSASRLISKLEPPFDSGDGGPGGWVILLEPEIHLGEHVVVPDIAGWKRSRISDFPETSHFEVAPDWICEILSPSTARIDRTEKLTVYAEQDVGYVWLIDPNQRTLEVLTLNNSKWLISQTFKDDDAVCTVPFEELKFDLQSLWKF